MFTLDKGTDCVEHGQDCVTGMCGCCDNCQWLLPQTLGDDNMYCWGDS